MDAACTIQDSIHVFSLVRKYVSRILGTYHFDKGISLNPFLVYFHPLCLSTLTHVFSHLQ